MKLEAYFNDVVYGLEKALYYERGRGAYFRATMVGVDFIERKKIEGSTPEEVIDKCIEELIESEIIQDATYKRDESGNLFTFEIKGSTHLPIDVKLREEGVPPYVCPPINMILHKIRQLTNLAVEIADINVNESEGIHIVNVVVFEQDLSGKKAGGYHNA